MIVLMQLQMLLEWIVKIMIWHVYKALVYCIDGVQLLAMGEGK
jgi:hypothetical protein